MSTAVKIILAVLGVGAALVAALVVAGYLWFQRNKDDLKRVGEEQLAAGSEFGRGRASPECVGEAIRRMDESSGLFQEVGHKLFLRACLGTADQPADFCEGVPPKSEIMQSVKYALGACAALGRPGDQPCTRLVQAVQEQCHGGT